MTTEDLRIIFDTERPYHSWTASHFGYMLSPRIMVLLELYARHPSARRSVSAYWRAVEVAIQPELSPELRSRLVNVAFSIRPPDYRRPFKGLDQKRLASGEKEDD